MVRVLPSGAAGSEPAPVFHRAALPILAHGAMPLPLSLAGWGPHPSEEQAGVALLRREGARRFCLQKPAGWASRGLQLAGWLMGRAPAWHREGAPGSGAMEAPREDVLQSSWVEVPLLGQEEPPTPACAPHRDMEQILLEAQLEVESPRAEGSFLALKAPGVEDLSPGQREDTEGSVQMGTLPWSWPSLPEHQKELACLPPACAPLLSPVLHRRRGLRDPQLLLLVIPSLLLSHVLALGLGICIGKRLAASPASSL